MSLHTAYRWIFEQGWTTSHVPVFDRPHQTVSTALLTEPLSLLSSLAESCTLVVLVQTVLDTFNGQSSQNPSTPCSSAALEQAYVCLLDVTYLELLLFSCPLPLAASH